MAIKVEFTNNSQAFLRAIPQAKAKALEECGEKGEEIASDLCPIDTGALRESIHHQVADDMVGIGTNMEYGPYVELGTGVYCTMGGGRSGWWVYVPGSSSSHRSGKTYTEEQARQIVAMLKSQGVDAHMTQGQKPQPFIKPAVADNTGTYRNIIENAYRNA